MDGSISIVAQLVPVGFLVYALVADVNFSFWLRARWKLVVFYIYGRRTFVKTAQMVKKIFVGK